MSSANHGSESDAALTGRKRAASAVEADEPRATVLRSAQHAVRAGDHVILYANPTEMVRAASADCAHTPPLTPILHCTRTAPTHCTHVSRSPRA